MFYDLDNDGDQDLFVGDNLGDVLLFLNVGSRNVPEFTLVEKPFSGTIPAYAAPTFGVLNGVPSLVVGSAPGQLVVYGEVPKFELSTTNFNPFDRIDVDGAADKGHSTPTFVDLDDDGDLDLVVGEDDGTLRYYRNAGTASQPTFEKVDEESPFDGIDSLDSAPIFVDLDGDGDQDLVVGEFGGTFGGTLNYYRNVGTPSQPKFEKVYCVDDLRTIDEDGGDCQYYDLWPDKCDFYNDEDFTASEQCCACGGGLTKNPFDGIDVVYHSTPAFVDVDNDGDQDLVVGEAGGKLLYYRNVGTPSQPIFQKVGCVDDLTTTNSAGNTCSWYIDNRWGCTSQATFQGRALDDEDFTASEQCCACGGGLTEEESPFDGIDVGAYSAPTFVDFNKDGAPDLVVGDRFGKLFYYRNAGTPAQPSFEKIEESPFDGIDVGRYSAPTFADLDNDGDLDLIVGSKSGRLNYFRNGQTCQMTSGACSRNGVCGALKDGQATCQCVAPWGGSQCGICAAGTYKDDDGDCQPCKSGMVCDEPGVTLENVRLEKNRWRTSPESTKIETCPLKNSCESGDDISVPATGEDLCKKGHEGPICAVCKRHYYRLGQECIKCRSSTIAFTVIGILVGIVIFLAFFLMAMSYSNVVAKGVNKSFETNQEEAEISLSRQGSTYFARADSAVQTADRPDPTDAGSGFKEWLEGEAAEALRRNVTTFVKQLSGTYSIFVNLPWVFDIKFPNVYEKVLERLGLVNVDMSFSLECVISRKVTFQDRLLAATIGPMVAILLVIISVEINQGSGATAP